MKTKTCECIECGQKIKLIFLRPDLEFFKLPLGCCQNESGQVLCADCTSDIPTNTDDFDL